MDHRRFIALTGILAAVVAIGGPAAASTGPANQGSISADATGGAYGSADHGGNWRWHDEKFDYYLALGDSLAAGVQPNAQGQSLPTNQGYANDLAARLRGDNRHLGFVDLGCPGETTTTMLDGGCPFKHSYADQVDAAVSFLAKHQHARVLVTIDIGANNVDGCTTPSGIDTACVAAGLQTAATDLPKIMGKLKAAAGRHVEFVAMNYYDPFLAAWLNGPAGQAEATASVQLSGKLNGVLGAAYNAFGVRVADVSARFDTTKFTPVVPLTPTLKVPLNVARICEWTWMCAPAPVGPNIHANKAGYEEIADSFEAIVDPR